MKEEIKLIKETAEAIKETIEAVEPVYEDGLKPIVKQVGTTLETIGMAINLALRPIRNLVWSYEQIERFLGPILIEKLKNTPKEQIITPSITIAGPTLEALRFASEESSLRELYAQLLATAMDSTKAKDAHPAFVEVIKQLTPDEAKIIQLFNLNSTYPITTVRSYSKDDNGSNDVLRYFSLFGYDAKCNHPDLISSYLDNLHRLRIIEILDAACIPSDIYKLQEEHPEVLKVINKINTDKDLRAVIVKRAFIITDFGKQFYNACVGKPSNISKGVSK